MTTVTQAAPASAVNGGDAGVALLVALFMTGVGTVVVGWTTRATETARSHLLRHRYRHRYFRQ